MDDKRLLELIEEYESRTPAQIVDTILGGISPVINTRFQVSDVTGTSDVMTYTLSRHDGTIAGYAHYTASTGAVVRYETPRRYPIVNGTTLHKDFERAVQSYLEWN